MSTQIINKVKDAQDKWEYWNDLGAQARAKILQSWSDLMSTEVALGIYIHRVVVCLLCAVVNQHLLRRL